MGTAIRQIWVFYTYFLLIVWNFVMFCKPKLLNKQNWILSEVEIFSIVYIHNIETQQISFIQT